MIEKRELPFVEPPIRFSPSIDYFLSLVSLNIDKTLPWILENYIDVVFNKTKGSNYFVMEFLDIYKLWWNCPFINVSRIPRRIVETGTIGEFVKTLIDNELYVMLIIDTFYIPEYTTYRKEHLAHEIFIYGYDSECLLVSDYFDFLLSKRKKIRFSDLSNGYNFLDRNEKDYLCGIVTFEINKDVILNGKPDVQFVNKTYVLDRMLLKTKIKAFLDSSPVVLASYPNEFDPCFGFQSGFNSFHSLVEVIDEDSYYLLRKPLVLLYDHIRIMEIRIEYLLGKESFLDYKCKKVFEMCSIIKGVYIKGLLRNQFEICKIRDLLNKLLLRYKDVIVELYNLI